MQVLTFPSGFRPSSVTDESAARLTAAKVLGVAGVVAYNWWVVVPFVPGLMPSVNGFFSDLEATAARMHALMSDADLIAGVLMAAALLLRGSTRTRSCAQGVEVVDGVRRRPGRSAAATPTPAPRA